MGLAALAAAAAVVWHYIPEREPAPAAVATAVADLGARRQQARQAGLELVTPGLPRRDPRPGWIALAQAGVKQADPWIIGWLRGWDRYDGVDASLEHQVQAVEAALMTGDTLLARSRYRRVQLQLADPRTARRTIDATLARRLEVLHLFMAGLEKSAMAKLQQTAGERPLAGAGAAGTGRRGACGPAVARAPAGGPPDRSPLHRCHGGGATR